MEQRRSLETQPWRRLYRTRAWQRAVEQTKRRDNYACARCGSLRLLSVHHVVSLRSIYKRTSDWQSFIAAACDPANLVTLCASHHREAERGE